MCSWQEPDPPCVAGAPPRAAVGADIYSEAPDRRSRPLRAGRRARGSRHPCKARLRRRGMGLSGF